MTSNILLYTSNGGEAGKSFTLLNTLAYFIKKREQEENESNHHILVIDANKLNANLFEEWLLAFRGQISDFPQTPLKLNNNIEVTLQYYVICKNIFVVRSQKTTSDVHLLSLLSSILESKKPILDGKLNPSLIKTVLLDTHLSLYEQTKEFETSDLLKYDLYPWIIWQPYSLNSSTMRNEHRKALRSLMSQFEKVQPFHILNPKLPKETSTSPRGFGWGRKPDSPQIASYNRFWNLLPGDPIEVEDFLTIVEQRIVDRFGFVGPLNEINLSRMHLKIGEVLLDTCTYTDGARGYGYTGASHRKSNIFAIPTYDPSMANLKQGGRTLVNLYEESLRKAQDRRRGDCSIIGLSEALGPVYLNLEKYLEHFFPIQGK